MVVMCGCLVHVNYLDTTVVSVKQSSVHVRMINNSSCA